MAMVSLVHTHLNHLILATLLNLPLLDMPLAGIRVLLKINNLRQVGMITTTNRLHNNSSKLLEVQLLQLILVPMVTTSNLPLVTAKDKLMPRMAMVDITHLLLNLVVIRVLVMSSNKVIALLLAMGMPQTQHQMARTRHMVPKVMAVKHLHQHQPRVNKDIILASSPALILVTHLKALLRLDMGCPQLLKVGMVHSQLEAMLLVMGPLRLKSLLVRQVMVNHSSLLVHKLVMLSLPQRNPGILNQLLNQVMPRLIPMLSDLPLLPMVLHQLSQVMVPSLMALRQVMASSHHLTTVPMVVTPSLQHMLLKQLQPRSLFHLVVGLQKHHLRVNISLFHMFKRIFLRQFLTSVA
uniref:Uncharacterized protein n=1 Tax=Spongospora subterranea TaxID=70186 RepID=A0A0H5QKY6_9EUKA|eukprot:CRZ02678.1 hypothetical protein [Spongospora subterranea]